MARLTIALVVIVAFLAFTATTTEAKPRWLAKLGRKFHDLGNSIEELAKKAAPHAAAIIKKSAGCSKQLAPSLPQLAQAGTCVTAAIGASAAGGNAVHTAMSVGKCGASNPQAAVALKQLAACIAG